MCAVTASNDATRIPTEDRPEYAFLKAQDEALREHEEKAKAFATPWNIVCATYVAIDATLHQPWCHPDLATVAAQLHRAHPPPHAGHAGLGDGLH